MPNLVTIQLAGKLLELFTRDHPEWGARQMARALELPKSSAHQMLASLEAIGLLHRMVTGRYRLGFRLLTLSQNLLVNTPWRDVAHRGLVQLGAALRQTVHLAVLDGGNLIYIDKLLGSDPVAVRSAHTNLGNACNPHSSALGRTLLASKSWRVVTASFERHGGLHANTRYTITDLEAFKNELNQIARQGFALDLEESRQEVCCFAAPIRNHNGDVIAAIGTSIISTRALGVDADTHDIIFKTANQISRSIGFDPEFVTHNRTQARLMGRTGDPKVKEFLSCGDTSELNFKQPAQSHRP